MTEPMMPETRVSSIGDDDRKSPHPINPHVLSAGYARASIVRAPGGKLYLAMFSNRVYRRMAHRKHFRTATGALGYARKFLARWCRLYDAALEAHASSVARS